MGPEQIDIPVDGGALRALRWGTGPNLALAVHGITASAMSYRPIGRRLSSDWTLVAVDLRGRGGSAGLPGPYGFDRHAADVLAVADHLGAERLVLTGHSMGAYVATLAAAARPSLVERLLLLDGGLPLLVSVEGLDVDAVLNATLGPALERLSMTFPSVAEYLDFWRPHPALQEGWNDDVEAYLTYDAREVDGAIRSRCLETAVREDGKFLLTRADAIGDALRSLEMPVLLLRAPRGLFDEPPGIQPDALVDEWRPQLPRFADEVIEANHYSIIFSEKGATTIVDAIEKGAGFP